MSLRHVVAAPARRALAAAINYGWEWVCRHGEITPDTPAGFRFRRFGEGACIAFPVGTVFGERWIEVGAHTLIAPHVTLSAGFAPGLDLGSHPIVRIGSGCSIGRGNGIIGHQSIEIGNDVFTGPNVYITDQNHTYQDPGLPIGRQWPRNDPVVIGDGCWIGAGAIILPGARLGRNVAVAGGAVVRGEFPDHCVIAGVPAKAVRHFDAAAGWQPPLTGRPPLASIDELQKLAGLSPADLEALHLLEVPLQEETG
ncbi:MAG TPA: DapH/DapD/GlmU-related protein [Streptosporangiaceae bacterium]